MKYFDKLQLFPNCIYVPERDDEKEIQFDNFHDALKMADIGEYGYKNIYVINPNASNIMPRSYTGLARNLEQDLAKYAQHRWISVSKDDDEIYSDEFNIFIEDAHGASNSIYIDFDFVYSDRDFGFKHPIEGTDLVVRYPIIPKMGLIEAESKDIILNQVMDGNYCDIELGYIAQKPNGLEVPYPNAWIK